MGWQPLGVGAYLHQGWDKGSQSELIIEVVGIPDLGLMGQNVLLLT